MTDYLNESKDDRFIQSGEYWFSIDMWNEFIDVYKQEIEDIAEEEVLISIPIFVFHSFMSVMNAELECILIPKKIIGSNSIECNLYKINLEAII